MTTLHENIAAHPLLAGLREDLVDAIAAFARPQSFAEGHKLLRYDAEIHDFYLLLSGRVALQINPSPSDVVPIQTLTGGDALGLSWMVPPYHSYFDATALEPVEVVAIDSAALRQAMEENHDLGYEVLKRLLAPMLSRLQACRLQVMDVYGQPDGNTPA